MVAFVPANALGQVSVEVLAEPLLVYSAGPAGGLLDPIPALSIEAGVGIPGGSAFSYGLRLRAVTSEAGGGELAALAEARVTPGLPMLGDWVQPVARGGFRIGRGTYHTEERWAVGPHLYFGAAFLLGGGAAIDLLIGASGSFLPFEASIGLGVALRAPLLSFGD